MRAGMTGRAGWRGVHCLEKKRRSRMPRGRCGIRPRQRAMAADAELAALHRAGRCLTVCVLVREDCGLNRDQEQCEQQGFG
jgi:hypothetical protein